MRLYAAMRYPWGARVEAVEEGRARPLRAVNLHAMELDWGGTHAACAEFAFILLADALGYVPAAASYQAFKREVLAEVDVDHFGITSDDITTWYLLRTEAVEYPIEEEA